MFEARLSIQGVQMFKPHRHAYWWAARKMGVGTGGLLVAAHGWGYCRSPLGGWRATFLPGRALSSIHAVIAAITPAGPPPITSKL